MDFKMFNFHPSISQRVRELGYETPTPIQDKAIPPVLEGRDVLGLAQTGTGKTAAFMLPILQRLRSRPRGTIRALIVAPTRELAEQIHEATKAFGSQTGLRSLTIYGGVGQNPQLKALRSGVEIVVACPGRLLDHLNHDRIDLSNVEICVIDEADRMFDMGFLPDIRRIMRHLPGRRQMLLFSATMPPDIRRLAHDFMHDPVTVQIGHTRPVDTVSHALYPVEKHLKTNMLIELLQHTDTESVLVFTRTKHRAKRLGIQLHGLGYKVASLQGNMSQNQRQNALNGFRDGSFQILIATDIAARGIDVTSISHVINYDIPDTPDAYTHRIGRTGRAARTGDAFTMITGEDEQTVRAIERLLGSRIDRRTIDGFDYNRPPPPRTHGSGRFPRGPHHHRGQHTANKSNAASPHKRYGPPQSTTSHTGRHTDMASSPPHSRRSKHRRPRIRSY